jgi:hypothetical protein
MAKKKLGMMQQYLLSEIVNARDWVDVGPEIRGSNYGGQKKHETMVKGLEERGLVEVQGEPGAMRVRAFDIAAEFV